jgi:hypothetical protein
MAAKASSAARQNVMPITPTARMPQRWLSAMPSGASRPIATGIRASFSPVTRALLCQPCSNAYDDKKSMA